MDDPNSQSITSFPHLHCQQVSHLKHQHSEDQKNDSNSLPSRGEQGLQILHTFQNCDTEQMKQSHFSMNALQQESYLQQSEEQMMKIKQDSSKQFSQQTQSMRDVQNAFNNMEQYVIIIGKNSEQNSSEAVNQEIQKYNVPSISHVPESQIASLGSNQNINQFENEGIERLIFEVENLEMSNDHYNEDQEVVSSSLMAKHNQRYDDNCAISERVANDSQLTNQVSRFNDLNQHQKGIMHHIHPDDKSSQHSKLTEIARVQFSHSEFNQRQYNHLQYSTHKTTKKEQPLQNDQHIECSQYYRGKRTNQDGLVTLSTQQNVVQSSHIKETKKQRNANADIAQSMSQYSHSALSERTEEPNFVKKQDSRQKAELLNLSEKLLQECIRRSNDVVRSQKSNEGQIKHSKESYCILKQSAQDQDIEYKQQSQVQTPFQNAIFESTTLNKDKVESHRNNQSVQASKSNLQDSLGDKISDQQLANANNSLSSQIKTNQLGVQRQELEANSVQDDLKCCSHQKLQDNQALKEE